jgi:hypothetical protein
MGSLAVIYVNLLLQPLDVFLQAMLLTVSGIISASVQNSLLGRLPSPAINLRMLCNKLSVGFGRQVDSVDCFCYFLGLRSVVRVMFHELAISLHSLGINRQML